MHNDKLIIYHAGCWDGFCAAWLFWRKFPDAEFRSAHYGDDPPLPEDISGRHVYIVDFSYPRLVLEQIYRDAASLIVLDHHKTAEQELRELPYCVFNMHKSGARLAHEYIDRAIDGVTSGLASLPHWLVLCTEDRDHWKWELEVSHEINAWLRSHPLDFELWEELAKIDWNSEEFEDFVREGSAILRSNQQTVDAKVKQSHIVHVERPRNTDGLMFSKTWCVANATTLVSETAGALALKTSVGCVWFEKPDGERIYSLRTTDEDVADVGDIAKCFGGGGHSRAAGFRSRVHPWDPIVATMQSRLDDECANAMTGA